MVGAGWVDTYLIISNQQNAVTYCLSRATHRALQRKAARQRALAAAAGSQRHPCFLLYRAVAVAVGQPPTFHSTQNIPSSAMRSFLPIVTTPDPNLSRLSVHQTLLQYPLVQLQVHPLRLSSAHLRLLGCAFVDTSPPDRKLHHTPPQAPPAPPAPPATEATEVPQSPSPVAIPSPREPSSPPASTEGGGDHADNNTSAGTCTPSPGFLLMAKPPARERWARRIALCEVLAGKQAAMMSLLEASPLAAKQSRCATPPPLLHRA